MQKIHEQSNNSVYSADNVEMKVGELFYHLCSDGSFYYDIRHYRLVNIYLGMDTTRIYFDREKAIAAAREYNNNYFNEISEYLEKSYLRLRSEA